MAPFYGRGSTASRLTPLQGGSLLFTTKSPGIPGTHFINLGMIWTVVLNTGLMDWESSTLTTRPLFHKGGFHKGAFIIGHIRRLYLMWYLINSWRSLSENPQQHPPPPPLPPPEKIHSPFKNLKSASPLSFWPTLQIVQPPTPSPCRKGGRTLRTGFSFTCGIVFHYRFRYDVLSEENISTLWSFGGMYILPSPVFFEVENSPSRRVGNLGWWKYDKEWFWPSGSSWKLKTIFCK